MELKHYRPHIHAEYGEYEVVIAIDEGDVLEGYLPKSRMKLVQAWVEIHKEELMLNWQLAITKQRPCKIEPLK
jgi:hypothetical protein